MIQTQSHVIRRLSMQAEVNGPESNGFVLQRVLPDLCMHRVSSAIEQVLDRMAPKQGHVFIERLELDAGTLSLGNLEQELAASVSRALEDQLGEMLPSKETLARGSSGSIQRRSEQQSVHEAFVVFLQTGSLPWWFHLPGGTSLEQAILDSWAQTASSAGGAGYARAMILDAVSPPSARARLVRQFSPGFLQELFMRLAPAEHSIVDDALREIDTPAVSPSEARALLREFWLVVYSRLANGEPQTTQALADAIQRLIDKTDMRGPALAQRLERLTPAPLTGNAAAGPADSVASAGGRPAAKTQSQASALDAGEGEGLYINCAGVVLLHPFLPRLFELLGIAREGKLRQTDRALCLLHYLATGQRVAPEYELPLPKVLCGLPLEHTAESDVGLTAMEIEEAETMLQAAIRHWEALGNSSADGLRGTFLVRPGKLSRRDDGDWRLQVEPRSFDILLDQLPWGLGIIKLPWMEKMLWVEWR